MRERGLDPDFSAAELAEVAALPGPPRTSEAPTRDLRALQWCSIDNDDSRDLDQLSVAEALPGGAVKILVAIADVDAAVPKGSTIDRHAAHNTTSVYTPGVVFPMLPERLSTDLTSLNEAEDRLAVVTEFVVAKNGDITRAGGLRRARAQSGEARLQRRRRVADRQRSAAAGRGGGAGDGPAAAHAGRGGAGAQRRPAQNGALDFETIEVETVFEGDTLRDLLPQAEKPRQGADREPDDRGQRHHRAVPRRARLPVAPARREVARALGSDSRAGRGGRARRCPPPPIRRRWPRCSRGAGRPTRKRFPISRGRSSSCSARASTSSIRRAPNRRDTSASRCGTIRTRRRRTAAIRTW